MQTTDNSETSPLTPQDNNGDAPVVRSEPKRTSRPRFLVRMSTASQLSQDLPKEVQLVEKSRSRDLERECLQEYQHVMDLCSKANLQKDVKNIAASIDAKIDEFIAFLNDFRAKFIANLEASSKLPLSDSDVKRFGQLKSDISTLAPELSCEKFKDKKFGQRFDNYLEIIKEFKGISAKAKSTYQRQLEAMREKERKIEALISSSHIGFDSLNILGKEDDKKSLNSLDDDTNYCFSAPENLEVTKKDNIQFSSIWKGACFIEEENMLALGGLTEISLYQWPSLTHIYTSLLCHQKGINRLIYSTTLKKLISCSSDMTVKLWNVRDKHLQIHKKYDNPGTVYAIEVMEESQKVLAAGDFSSIYIWNLLDDSSQVIQCNFGAPILAMKLMEPSQRLAVANSYDGCIWIYSMRDLKLQCKLEAHCKEKPIWFVDYFPQKDLLYSAGSDGVINVWSGQHGKTFQLKRRITKKGYNITELCTSCADGKIIGLSSTENESYISIWDKSSDDPINVIDFPNFSAAMMIYDNHRKELLVAANAFDGLCTIIQLTEKTPSLQDIA